MSKLNYTFEFQQSHVFAKKKRSHVYFLLDGQTNISTFDGNGIRGESGDKNKHPTLFI
jgi:hypothetical protein